MNFSKFIIFKICIIFISSQLCFSISKVNSAENIKIIYNIFSRTITLDDLKEFSEKGYSKNKLKRIFKATGSTDKEIHNVLTKNFDIPIPIASKLVNSEVGNIFLTRLSTIIHPPKAIDEKTGMLALRASVIQGLDMGEGKINLIKFFEAYPTKTVVINVNHLSKVMNKVESISELLSFFTNSPLEKIKPN